MERPAVYASFEEMLRTMKEDPRPALYYGGRQAVRAAGDGPEVLSRAKLCEQVIARVQVIRREELPLVFAANKTPEAVIDLLAYVVAGQDIILIEPGAKLPEGFVNRPVLRKEAGKGEGFVLFFTSGTTSAAKAVVLSSRALLRSCYNGQSLCACGPGDTILALLPFSHVFGFICCFLWGLAYGAAIALGRGLDMIFRDPLFFQPTILSAVPSMAQVMATAGALNPQMRLAIIGAAPCGADLLELLASKGIEVHAGYGLTETASGIALHTDDPDPLALTPCPDADFRIEEDGEVTVATPCLMEGYLEDPEPECIRDGRLYTGDLGRMNERGHLLLMGRKKEFLTLANGTKIFCPQEEACLIGLLGLKDLAVAEPDGQLALVIGGPLPEGASKEKIKELVEKYNETRPRDQRIHRIDYRPGPLERTATGKVMRWKL